MKRQVEWFFRFSVLQSKFRLVGLERNSGDYTNPKGYDLFSDLKAHEYPRVLNLYLANSKTLGLC